jgi:putative nucleotidyltransferase with HDIG domain
MPTRDDAYRLMKSHVKNENLQKHMLAVEVAMRFYARQYGEEEELWAMTGLLHDCDYEEYPDLREHTHVSAGWLREGGYDERIIYAILAHNDLNVATHPRNNLLSRALYACDEVTGMITATALVRPNKSITGLEVASVRKKMKSKGFAAGVNREDLFKGAAELGVELDEHIALVIEAMSSIADTLLQYAQSGSRQGEMSQPAPHNSTGSFTGDTIQQITEEVK